MVSLQQDLACDAISPTSQWESFDICGPVEDPGGRSTVAHTPGVLEIANTPSGSPTNVFVSTAFYPGAHGLDADLVFCSSDSVLFYVHSPVLSTASKHAFRPILHAQMSDLQPCTSVTYVPATSIVLNIIIHALYGMSSAQYSPPFAALITAIDQMPYYEIDPKRCVVPSNPLHMQLLSHASANPLELYALAARHDIYDIAAHASSHLISYPLNTISDEIAIQIGAVYLKRLLCLHVERSNALRNIVLVPPRAHPPTTLCDFNAQQSLTRAWATAVSSLAGDARPDISTAYMRSVFAPLQNQLTCSSCRENFSDRVEDVVFQWSFVKCTI